MPHWTDLTDLVSAARTNDPAVLSVFAERFPRARLKLPLASREGLKNRPESAVELGAGLPAHRLRLDSGERAIPVFTRAALCHQCAERLSWKTDGGAVKTLTLPGSAALAVMGEFLVAPGIERVVVNPLSDGALHLARTDVDAIVTGKPLRSLWFYSRDGRLKMPVEIEGSSLLSSLLTTADRVFQRLTEPTPLGPARTSEILEGLPVESPLAPLAAEIVPLLETERVESLELAVTKTSAGVRVEATPPPSGRLLARIHEVVERHLKDSPENTNVTLRIGGGAVVLRSSQSTVRVKRAEEMRNEAPAPPRPPSYSYIPLEPESPGDEESPD